MTGAVLIALGVWLMLANIAGLILFAQDKRAAQGARWRVPERLLLTTAALGASPAMLIATGWFRHKTQKQPFRALLIAIAVVQAIAAIGLLALWAGFL